MGRLPSAAGAIAMVLIVLVPVIVGQSLARRVVPTDVQSWLSPIAGNVLGFLPVYLILWIWLRFRLKRPFHSLGFERQGAWRYAAIGGLAAALMIGVTAALAIAPGAAFAPGKVESMGAAAFGVTFLSLLAYLVQGPAEEVLFRGWLMAVIGARYRPWIGVVASSLVFSLAHKLSPDTPWLALVNLFLFGVFCSLLALAEGGLWGACVWHGVWNWMQFEVLGIDTGPAAHTGLFSSIRASGPQSIAGGSYGIEAGLAATVVFVIAIGVVMYSTRLR